MADSIDILGQKKLRSASFPEPEYLFRAAWAIIAAAGLVLSVHLILRAGHGGDDSWLPMTRALDFLRQSTSDPVYQALFFGEKIKFQYPPSSLLIVDLLSHVGITTPAQYNTVNAVVLIVSALVFARFASLVLGHVSLFGVRVPIAPIAFLIALRYFPNQLAFELGQIQIWIGLFFILSCLLLWQGRPFVSGLLIGASAVIKPQFCLFGVLALWRRNWRFLAACASVVVAAVLLSTWLYGWRAQFDYLSVLSFLSRHGEYHHLNQSIGGVLVRLFYDGPPLDRDAAGVPIPAYVASFPPYLPIVYAITTATSVVMIVAAFLLRGTGDEKTARLQEFTLAAMLFTMASPIAWVHHYNVLLPAYVIALKGALERQSRGYVCLAAALLAISYGLTGFRLAPPYAPTVAGFSLVQSHVLIGAWILLGVLIAQSRFQPKVT